jgi:Bacterial Ig domain
VFTTADFGFADPNDSPANALLSVTMTTLPGAGNLTDNAVAVTAGQQVSLADIAGGRLQFAPAANANGAAYASFNFQVRDDGGTANGGVDLDPTARTMTIGVTAVNDAPVLDNTGTMTLTTITEDNVANGGDTVSSIIASAGANRITDADSGAVEGFAVTGLTGGNGTWQYSTNGGASWNTVGSVSDTAALLLRDTDRLRLVPDGQNGTAASVTFRAWDQTSGAAGTKVDASTNGGATAFSSALGSAAITVTSVNDAPVLAGSNNLNAIPEDPSTNSGTLVSSLIASHVTDVDSAAVSGVAVTAVDGSNGAWQYSTDGGGSWNAFGVVSAASARLLAADASTYVRFVPNTDWNGTVSSGITFKAWDQTSGTAGSSADTTSGSGGTTAFSAATVSSGITVTSVNDAPHGADKTVTTLEDTPYVFTTADFGFADPHDSPANALLSVTITTMPGAGGLTDNGVAVTAGQQVSVADIAGGRLRFAPAADANGTGYASFTFQVRDGGGTANGGVDLDPIARSMTIDVTAVNDAPGIVAPAALTVVGNTATPLTGISFTDVDSAAGNVSATFAVPRGQLGASSGGGVTIAGSATSLTLTGTVANVNAFISGGGLSYTTANFDPNPVSLTVTINDQGNTGSGGPLSSGPLAVVLNVNVINQPPVNTLPAPVTAVEDTPITITGISVVDPEGDPTTVQLAVANGVLTVDLAGGASLSAGANGSASMTLSGTQAQINAALATLGYQAGSNFNGADSVTVRSTDGWGAVTASSLAINVTPVNDAPTATITASHYTVLEQTTLALQGTGMSIADVDAGNGTVTAQLAVGEGVLNIWAGSNAVVVAGSGTGVVTLSGTVAQINALLAGAGGATVLYFNGSDAPSASTTLNLTVNDQGNTGGGALQASASVTIAITAVDDAPNNLTFTSTGMLVSPTAAGTVAGSLIASDPDDSGGFVFSLTDSAAGRFSIDPVTGVVRVAAPGLAGVTSAQNLGIVVRVADTSGLFIERSFTVSIAPEVLAPGGGGGFGPPVPEPNPTGRFTEFNDSSESADTGTGSAASQQALRLQIAIPPSSVKGFRAHAGQADPMAGSINATGWMHVAPERFNNGMAIEIEYRLPDEEIRKRVFDSRALFELLRDRSPLRGFDGGDGGWFDRSAPAPSIHQIAWQDAAQSVEAKVYRTVVDSVQIGGVMLSVGIVLWVARAGGLLAAMLTSMPAWRALDPLVLLAPGSKKDRHWEQAEDTELYAEEAAVADVLGDARQTKFNAPQRRGDA